MSESSWEDLGATAPKDLIDARLQLHHAAQLVSAVGKTLLEAKPDDSHPNLGWRTPERALGSHPIPGESTFQAALRPEGLELLLIDGAGDVVDAHGLEGETQASGAAWLSAAIERHFARPLPQGLTLPGYEIPSHGVGAGEVFSADGAALAELGRWFGNADAALGELAAHTEGASDVRCWPHHFDLATLVAVEVGADGAATKTVGLGFSPGDDGYPEPYWYVSPWPYPDASLELPELPPGAHWHREGYTAAILPASAHVVAADQRACLADFLATALAAGRRIHGL